ncbi:hypothetical protein ACFYYS_06225 [Streptomyces sp. NPDC002120]|uniref:hypothetical protein n=1 Tax=Streptomyces sp. NPDC002120 TaxID=3364631 RepID=UPI0036D0BAB1
MAYDKGKPSLEAIIADLDARVKALEFAPQPEIPKKLEVDQLIAREVIGARMINGGSSLWRSTRSDSNGIIVEWLDKDRWRPVGDGGATYMNYYYKPGGFYEGQEDEANADG